MKYYIIDLERTFEGDIYYWKQDAYGYTDDKDEAGIFTQEEAKCYCLEDVSGYTVMQPIEKKITE